MGRKTEQEYSAGRADYSGLPFRQYKREPDYMSRAAELTAVHFTLDLQDGFCYSGIRSA